MEIASLDPFTTYTNPGQGSPTNLTYPAPYNNLGIKGAFLYDVLNARSANTCYTANFGVPNPLFDAVLRGFGTQLELAIAQDPTLITLWIGNNDILAFATRGGLFPPTDPAVFQTQYTQVLTALHSTGAQIIIGGMPNALLTPYFTTVGPGVGQAISGIPGAQGLVYHTTGAPGINVAPASDLISKNVLITLSGSAAAGLIGDQTGKYYTDNGIPVALLGEQYLVAAAAAYVFFALGNQPIENSLIAHFTPRQWRSTGYGFAAILIFGVGEKRVSPAPLASPPLQLTLRPFDRRFKTFLLTIILFSLGNSSDSFLILKAKDSGISVSLWPILWMALHITKSLSATPGGILSDRYGRKKMILAG